ncbi:MAG: glycosyltransferase family 4 protein, partial [Janthinobacterium lividum]
EDGVTGVLVPSHDPRAWADALRGLLDDPDGREVMGRRAAQRAQGFGWDATAEATLEVYGRAIEARRVR